MALSYTHVYDAVRRERSQQDLQELTHSFYADVTELFIELQAGIRGLDESSESARIQLLNARKLTKQLYELREQKILQLAQDRCRTGSALVDTSRLLPAERTLFEQLVRVLSEERSRLGVLSDGVPTGTISRPTPLPSGSSPASVLLNSEIVAQAASAASATLAQRITIKVIKAVPAFVGKGMETYGPFEENERIELPIQVAQVLIRKGNAQEADEDIPAALEQS